MENLEEARIEENGDVTIRYYYGREVRVPKIVMQGELVKAIKQELKYIRKVTDNSFVLNWKYVGMEYSLKFVLRLLGEDLDEDNM